MRRETWGLRCVSPCKSVVSQLFVANAPLPLARHRDRPTGVVPARGGSGRARRGFRKDRIWIRQWGSIRALPRPIGRAAESCLPPQPAVPLFRCAGGGKGYKRNCRFRSLALCTVLRTNAPTAYVGKETSSRGGRDAQARLIIARGRVHRVRPRDDRAVPHFVPDCGVRGSPVYAAAVRSRTIPDRATNSTRRPENHLSSFILDFSSSRGSVGPDEPQSRRFSQARQLRKPVAFRMG